MPVISAEDRYLTVLNLFTADSTANQERLLGEMRQVVDTAAYPGWISSTVHAAQERPGTANFIQWRSGEDLEARYAGEEFKHRTLPVFTEITTSIRLLQNEVVYAQDASGKHAVEISPAGGDFTVIELFGVAPQAQDDLADAVGPGQDWLRSVPGYRGHTVLKGLRARGLDGAFVVVYSQWDDKQAHDAFLRVPSAEQPAERVKSRARIESLTEWTEWNSYLVVHTRSAGQ
jgi:heme-degrading monooxygenase HmoA